MITVIADDLSGAAEAAEQFRLHGHDVLVELSGTASRTAGTGVDGGGVSRVSVIDTDSRSLEPHLARSSVAAALRPLDGHLVVKKIDSLWRGNIAAEIEAMHVAGYRVVIAGALPALERTVVGGAPFVSGHRLHETAHWYHESTNAPLSVADAVGLRAHEASALDLAVVRGAGLLAALESTLALSRAVVVDGENDRDLAAVVEAVAALGGAAAVRVALVGTAALAAAVAERFAPEVAAPLTSRPPAGATARHALAVVGTGAVAAEPQLAALRASGVAVIALDPRHGTAGDAAATAALTAALGRGTDAAIALVSPERVEPRDAVRRLAAVVNAAAGADPALDLVLTGGETARCVLDLLGVQTLRPLGQVEHGAVVSETATGRLVATKPGSFGSPGVLVALIDRLRELRESRSSTPPDVTLPDSLPHDTLPHDTGDPMDTHDTSGPDTRPFIAVTMGDGAGVGPEITVGALLDPAAYRDGRPIVIGDTARLRMGAAALGVDADIVEIDDVTEAEFTPGRINVIDPHLLSDGLPWGQVSAEAGNAAYHYIRIACELGMAGLVQGICTAPLNKAALHQAGHVYPGHTELLAHFMGVGEVSMMLSTPKIKVIHVTTHIGLIDAIATIEPGLVERTVRRGWEALRRAGVGDPTIGVCAINPHAGENGLFGYGEEAEKITPAIEILQAEGMKVAGPLPADTAFFLGGRGDYDLIVAMYHDQGHGPVKVLGIEAGVNITVGLPVIRTSVDHGTAFDIAGTGTVAVGSMIEALRQAVEMSPSPVDSGPVAPSPVAPAAA